MEPHRPDGSVDDEQVLEQYLCRELSDEQRSVFEKRLVADPRLVDFLLAVEDDLVSDYACGRLSAERTARFARHLAGMPDAEHRLALARALADLLPPPQHSQARWWLNSGFDFRRVFRLPLVTATAAVILVFALVKVADYRQARFGDSGPIREDEPTARPAEPRPTTSVLTFSLSPGRERGSGAVRLAIPAGRLDVRLDLHYEDPGRPTELRASLQGRGGTELLDPSLRFRPDPGVVGRVVVTVSSDKLVPDAYILILTPVWPDRIGQPLRAYIFEVVRE